MEMNVERLRRVADTIERAGAARSVAPGRVEGLRQQDWIHGCGTPACIAAFALADLHGGAETLDLEACCEEARRLGSSGGPVAFQQAAQAALGLSDEHAQALFASYWWMRDPAGRQPEWRSFRPARPAEAAATLRHLAESGIVRYDVPAPDGPQDGSSEGG